MSVLFPLESFANRIYEDIAPLAFGDDGADDGSPLAVYVGALGAMFQIVDDLARDQVLPDGTIAPGWSQAVDITRAPSSGLAWLAQFVGGVTQIGLTDAEQRNYIKQVGGWSRGTTNAMLNAILPLLTGNQTVIFVERNGTNDTIWDFESGTESWVLVNGAAISQDATQFRGGGAHSLKIAGGTTAFSGAKSPAQTVTANTKLGARGSILVPAGQTWRAVISDLTHSVNIAYVNIVGTGYWQEFALSGETTLASSNVVILVDNNGGTTAVNVNIDDVHWTFDGPYALTVITRTAETPSTAAVLAALLAQKPAGIILTYAATTGFTYLELRADQATYTSTRSYYTNYQNLRGY